MQALWKVCANPTVAPWQCPGAWLATLHLFHRSRAERAISHLLMLLTQQKYPGMPCGREYAAFHGA